MSGVGPGFSITTAAVLCVDVLDDPLGLGRDAFPSTLAFAAGSEDDPASLVATSAVRAAYLTVKRLRKRIGTPSEWERIGALARRDPDGFRYALIVALGPGTAKPLADVVLNGKLPPSQKLSRRARRRQQLRRFRTPARAVVVPAIQLRRLAARISQPTGLFVVVAGPDGVGKSSLAANLPDACSGLFRRSARHHSRPGLLPRPGAVLGRPAADVTQPHARLPHGRLLSAALVCYHWLDFMLAYALRVAPFRARTGLVVVERGWWDLAVDPTRYRIGAPRRFVAALGRLLPRADLTLVLTAPEEVIRSRKPELPRDELARQQLSWRQTLPARETPVFVDAGKPEQEVSKRARDIVVAHLEERTLARVGAGWASLPPGAQSRWRLPRGPRTLARAALGVYYPNTTRGLFGWQAARVFASMGGFRLLPRSSAPPKPLREALAPHLPPRSTYAVAKASHPGRYTALIVDERGCPHAIAKLATDEMGRTALAREADMLESHARLLAPPLMAPVIVGRSEGVLVLEHARWRARRQPWVLPAEVAHALGASFPATSDERGGSPRAFSHGDFTPWNLLRTADGWLVVDWEAARGGAPAFHDVFHFFVQAHWLLKRPRADELYEGLDGKGSVADAIAAYAEGAGIDPASARPLFESYLRSVPEVAGGADWRLRAILVRQRLLHGLAQR